MLSFQQQQNPSSNVAQAMQNQTQLPPQDSQTQIAQHQQPSTLQAMRLRDNPPAITPPAPRPSRKRKTPPNNESNQPPPAPGPQPIPHVLPPPHAMMHPLSGPLPPYPYPPADYTPAGLPPTHVAPPQDGQSPGQMTNNGRTLSMTKRAEQNRKAQRAFRERRDQHVKALESRSQLLDAALASADEANRRWEECRALVDQLRVENAALRAALSQAQLLPPGTGSSLPGQRTDEMGKPEGLEVGEAANKVQENHHTDA